jgi:sensor c-di-GMP phosphodiesterase-like protein
MEVNSWKPAQLAALVLLVGFAAMQLQTSPSFGTRQVAQKAASRLQMRSSRTGVAFNKKKDVMEFSEAVAVDVERSKPAEEKKVFFEVKNVWNAETTTPAPFMHTEERKEVSEAEKLYVEHSKEAKEGKVVSETMHAHVVAPSREGQGASVAETNLHAKQAIAEKDIIVVCSMVLVGVFLGLSLLVIWRLCV